MDQDTILGLVRHVLTAVGGYFIAKGVISDAQLPDLVGAVMTFMGFAWSVYDKKTRA